MAYPGTLHRYTRRLVAFEHTNPTTANSQQPPPRHTLLCIGGLTDGLLTNTYPSKIAAHLPPTWRVAEVLLSSSYSGWATGSIARDARELGECVKYFRNLSSPSQNSDQQEEAKIVLLGCSTGCQDALEYVIGAERSQRPAVNGIILQAGVSDREAWYDIASRMPPPPGSNPSSETNMIPALEAAIATATKMVKEEGKPDDIMPKDLDVVRNVMGEPTTAYRTWSLLAKGGDDDFFSSDLDDDALKGTFGAIGEGVRVGLVWGSEDEYVPKFVEKEKVLARWGGFVRDGGGVLDEEVSGVIKGASHTLNKDPEEVVGELIRRVVGFLKGVEGV
ncbi:DUF1749-domain-containing protein [Periconia macrospinosa]|uniref:DUF1749-domain-containing protein n=1 Tax=Periconia macrospinosa TaxID=97972 RepID=A0A2V1DRZ3_9PLEO|nr:DUF1749-domain-containing protein [Periconia macrospinosa]